jgi:F-type H+-transporting ATPase subunit b
VISVDWTLLVQFVNFIILMIVLNALLYRPLRGVIERRRETAEEAHGKARDLQSQIEEKIARYEEKLQAAKSQGNQEKAALRQAGAAEEAGILGKAREEANVSLQGVKDQVSEAAATARQQLKNSAEELSSEIAEKILGRAL